MGWLAWLRRFPRKWSAAKRRKAAAAVFQERRYADAAPLFAALLADTGAEIDRFNVMICDALIGRPDEAMKAYAHFEADAKRLLKPRKPDHHDAPPFGLLTYYLGCALQSGGHSNRAEPLVERLRDMLVGYQVTDSHFLYIRGAPFLEWTVKLANDVFASTNSDRSGWWNDFAASLDADGRKLVNDMALRPNTDTCASPLDIFHMGRQGE